MFADPSEARADVRAEVREAERPPADEIVDRHRGLLARTILVSALTLLSRISGFVREVLAAALFGDRSVIWDAFLTAWRVPNLFRRLFGEGAMATALQTAMTEADAEAGNEAGRRLFLRTARLLVVALSLLCVAAMAVTMVLPDAMLGPDPGPLRELVVRLLPFVVLVCLAAACGGALQVRGHYTTPNIGPALMNLVWIVALLWVGFHFIWRGRAPEDGAALQGVHMEMARSLTWAALFAGVLQVVVQVPAMARHGLLPGHGEAGATAAVTRHSPRDVLLTSLPLAFGATVYQINVMVDAVMAVSLLPVGAPTAHYLANRVQQFPLSLVALAATSVIFPSLKALGHRGRTAEFRELHDRAQLGVVFLALPASVGLFVLAEPIAAVLFEHGNYGWDGVARIAAALRMLALALLPAGAVGLVSRAYYALGDMRTPVITSVVALALNAGLNLIFVTAVGMDVDGLALATAISSWGQLAWLLPGLTRRFGLPRSTLGAARRIATMAAAAAGSGALAVGAHWATAAALGVEGAQDASRSPLALLGGAIAGTAGYLALAKVLGVPEWSELRSRLASRRRRRR